MSAVLAPTAFAEQLAASRRVHKLDVRSEEPQECPAAPALSGLEEVRAAALAVAEVEAEQAAHDAHVVCLPMPERDAMVPAWQALQDKHADRRPRLRVGVLRVLDGEIAKAAREHQAAADMVADAAARLEGLATLRDELVRRPSFDPLGVWPQQSILAAPLHLRAPGWCVVPDAFGRDAAWTPMSARHADAVRKTKAAFIAEIQGAMCGARWPF